MSIKRLFLAVFVVFCLMLPPFIADAGKNEGSVKGTVHKDSASGKELSGVKVKCGGESDKTDDDGKFKIKGIKKGEHTLKFSKDGYESYEMKVKIKAGETANVNDRWLVKESSSGAKSGSKSCPSGNGLYCGDAGKGQNAGYLYQCTNGSYSLKTACGNGCQRNAAGTNDSCKTSSSPSVGALSGTVRKNSASGKALSGVKVKCGGESDTTDDDGKYKVRDIPAGNQTATFSKQGYETYSRDVEIKAGYTAKLDDRWLIEGSSSAPAKCPSGNGLYCGDTRRGQNSSHLYQCTNGSFSLRTACSNGCQQNATGKDDSCKATSPGSSGQVPGSMTEKVKSDGTFIPPNFNSSAYSDGNIFWRDGYAPKEFYDKPSRSKLVERGIYAQGNCTWYAKGRLIELGYKNSPFSKNAKDWDQQAKDADLSINKEPQVGCIAQSDTMNKNLGHVAVVESINDDGSIIVTESSYAPGDKKGWDFRYRTKKYDKDDFANYIHVPKN